MRTSKYLMAVAVLGIETLAVGCASAPPPKELLDARAVYQRAENGPAKQYDPVALHEANTALRDAEKTFKDDGDSDRAKDLAYVALRKAQLAETKAAAEINRASQQQAHNQIQELTRNELSQAKAGLKNANQQLAQETAARTEAEQRAKAALDRLAKIAEVKKDDRGTVITLPGGVLFTTGQSTLLPAAKSKLDEVAGALRDQSGHSITIYGYTDAQGSEDKNLELSRKRAQTVRDYLVSRGVPQDAVRADGKGEAEPVADNTTSEGRAMNRRVEVVIGAQSHNAQGGHGGQGGNISSGMGTESTGTTGTTGESQRPGSGATNPQKSNSAGNASPQDNKR